MGLSVIGAGVCRSGQAFLGGGVHMNTIYAREAESNSCGSWGYFPVGSRGPGVLKILAVGLASNVGSWQLESLQTWVAEFVLGGSSSV
jgi:hypothetical protein